jgi:arsenite methyltransferase
MKKFDVKKEVSRHYGAIAAKVDKGSKASCCGGGSGCGCSSPQGDLLDTSVLYEGQDLSALPPEALAASLGCANPLLVAGLKPGETVLDLGSGGGIDVLAASGYVGPEGKVYGLDMTDEMLALAEKNKARMGVKNVEFVKGVIEDIPLAAESVDVVMSNCVINLSEDKPRALSEAFRVLKKGGRFAVADIVCLRDVPPRLRKRAEMWCSCLAGTLSPQEYAQHLAAAGFTEISVDPEHIYTKELIEEGFLGEVKRLGVKRSELEALDGAFAGAFIRARKP